jgi:glycosyltransferase 2 family protein
VLGRTEISEQKPKRSNEWRRVVPGLIISAVSLAVVLSLIDLRKFAEAIRQANYIYLAISAILSVSWLVVRAVVWRTLLRERATYAAVFLTLNEGYLLNNVLPFRLGEIGRAFLLGRKAHLTFWEVLSSVVIERTLDLAMAVGLFLSMLPFVVGVNWAGPAAGGVGVIVLLGLLGLYGLARNRQLVLSAVGRAGARWSIVDRLMGDRLSAFLDGLSILTDLSRFARALLWMLMNWGMGVVMYYLLMLAFFPHAQPLWAVFTLGAASLGIAAPSSPGAIGVFEAVVVGALAIFDPNHSAAAAYAFFIHLFSYFFSGIFGVYGFSKEGETVVNLYRELRRVQVRGGPGKEA